MRMLSHKKDKENKKDVDVLIFPNEKKQCRADKKATALLGNAIRKESHVVDRQLRGRGRRVRVARACRSLCISDSTR